MGVSSNHGVGASPSCRSPRRKGVLEVLTKKLRECLDWRRMKSFRFSREAYRLTLTMSSVASLYWTRTRLRGLVQKGTSLEAGRTDAATISGGERSEWAAGLRQSSFAVATFPASIAKPRRRNAVRRPARHPTFSACRRSRSRLARQRTLRLSYDGQTTPASPAREKRVVVR